MDIETNGKLLDICEGEPLFMALRMAAAAYKSQRTDALDDLADKIIEVTGDRKGENLPFALATVEARLGGKLPVYDAVGNEIENPVRSDEQGNFLFYTDGGHEAKVTIYSDTGDIRNEIEVQTNAFAVLKLQIEKLSSEIDQLKKTTPSSKVPIGALQELNTQLNGLKDRVDEVSEHVEKLDRPATNTAPIEEALRRINEQLALADATEETREFILAEAVDGEEFHESRLRLLAKHNELLQMVFRGAATPDQTKLQQKLFNKLFHYTG